MLVLHFFQLMAYFVPDQGFARISHWVIYVPLTPWPGPLYQKRPLQTTSSCKILGTSLHNVSS